MSAEFFPQDLGDGYSLRFYSWKPERELNPQYDGIPDLDVAGAIMRCKHGNEGSINFDRGDVYKEILSGPYWTVESWEPLTLSPSIDSGCCHGYIREGRWVTA